MCVCVCLTCAYVCKCTYVYQCAHVCRCVYVGVCVYLICAYVCKCACYLLRKRCCRVGKILKKKSQIKYFQSNGISHFSPSWPGPSFSRSKFRNFIWFAKISQTVTDRANNTDYHRIVGSHIFVNVYGIAKNVYSVTFASRFGRISVNFSKPW